MSTAVVVASHILCIVAVAVERDRAERGSAEIGRARSGSVPLKIVIDRCRGGRRRGDGMAAASAAAAAAAAIIRQGSDLGSLSLLPPLYLVGRRRQLQARACDRNASLSVDRSVVRPAVRLE